jgi:hypothetical protein
MSLAPLVGATAARRAGTANTAPIIRPAKHPRLQLAAGDVAADLVVASARDAETPPGDLAVTLLSGAQDLTITNVTNTNGTVTADIAAWCYAISGLRTFTLEVSDGSLTSTATVVLRLTRNPGPRLGGYGDTTAVADSTVQLDPGVPPADGSGSVGLSIDTSIIFPGSYYIDPGTGVLTLSNVGSPASWLINVGAYDACDTTWTWKRFRLTVVPQGTALPTARAGADLTTSNCTRVRLDGTTSTAAAPLSYRWTQEAGTAVVLDGADTPTPSFEAPNVAGTEQLVFLLSVFDGAYWNSDTVVVTVTGGAPGTAATPGLYAPGGSAFFLRNCNVAGAADLAFGYGAAGLGYVPLSGDWDGDGVDTIGLYDPATSCFYLRNSNTPGPADVVACFGAPGGVPVSGDWDGDGVDTVGVYRPESGVFFLKNSNEPGVADLTFQFGSGGAGYAPLTGDWDGDGVTTVGLYNSQTGVFFLRNANGPGAADLAFQFGAAGQGSVPVAGDWDGDGATSVGIYVPSTSVFFLEDANAPGAADYSVQYGAAGGAYTPLAGDWDGL